MSLEIFDDEDKHKEMKLQKSLFPYNSFCIRLGQKQEHVPNS